MKKLAAFHLFLPVILLTGGTNAAAGRRTSEPTDAGSETALIRKGLDLRQKGQDEEALKEFRRAYELSKSARALAQIALAEQALGRWLEAESHLTEALTHTQESWISHNKTHLDQALYDIQGHLGSLELPGAAKEGTVKVDGVQVALLPLTAPLRVPAGSIALEVQATGYLPIVRTVVVPARGMARERLVFVAAAPAARPLPPPPLPLGNPPPQPVSPSVMPKPERPLPPTSTWGAGQTVGVILGVAALGALGTGITFHVLHESRAKSYNNNKSCNSVALPGANCQSLYDSINSAKYIFIAGYAGAAVLGGVATYLLLTGSRAPADKVAAAETGFRFQCSPTAGLGVVCAGRF
jgi:hypothetical protein